MDPLIQHVTFHSRQESQKVASSVIILVLQPPGFIGTAPAFLHVTHLLPLICKQGFSTVTSLVQRINFTTGMEIVIPPALLFSLKRLLEVHLRDIIAIILAKQQSFSTGTILVILLVILHLNKPLFIPGNCVIRHVIILSISTLMAHAVQIALSLLFPEKKPELAFATIQHVSKLNMLQLGIMNACQSVKNP